MSFTVTALGIGDAFSALHYTSCLLLEASGVALIAWLAPADQIIHEANLGPAHTPYESLAALPWALRARMRVTHLPDGFEPDAALQPLRQGERLEV